MDQQACGAADRGAVMISVDIRCRVGDFPLDVQFRGEGGVTALFGRSGAGKSSVVNAIAGLLRPETGRIVIGDDVLFDAERGIDVAVHKRRIGCVFQDARLFPHLTVRQNLTYGARFSKGRDGAVDFDRIVDLLGISAILDRGPQNLSGGEKSRVALGRAFLSRPRLLLMDEPFAALDDQRKAELLPYLERLRDEFGIPIVYVSHAMAEVARLADTLVLMADGRVTRFGPVADVLSDAATAPLLGLREAGAILQGQVLDHAEDGLTQVATAGGTIWLPRMRSGKGAKVRLRILAQDVLVATEAPNGLSALNVLRGQITDIRIGNGPGALIQIALGDDRILARITRRSAQTLGLAVGKTVYAILKTVSVAPENIADS